MNCIGCKKKLKKGEFVVLGGGSLLKTKTGAMMEDKNHIGFLTVNNHFDSKKNYKTFVITDQQPNGQFEFYACSHKCLADFMHRSIMQLAKFDKIKKFEIAPLTQLEKIGYEWGIRITELIGVKGAMITDESMICDFTSPWTGESKEKFLARVSKKLGFKVKGDDYVWQVAKKYKTAQANYDL